MTDRIREFLRNRTEDGPVLVVDLEAFTQDGFIKVEQAAPRTVADAARAQLWHQLPVSPDDPATWSPASNRSRHRASHLSSS